jgi:CRP-like cAMP-binding protein
MLQNSGPSLQRFLDRLTSHSVLSAREQNAILNLPTYPTVARPNQDFVRLGQQVTHACFVLDGLVGRFDQNAQGARQIIALYIPGDMPDLHSVVQPTATSALHALSPATILRVPHDAIRAVAGAYPAVAEALWRDCMVDSMIIAQWVVNIGCRDAKTRIAHLICEMACRYKAASLKPKVVFNLPMTQLHLAEATGLTAVHVNRMLGELRNHGLEFRRGTVYISDWDRLVRAGDFDPAYLQAEVQPEARIQIVQSA